MSKASYPLKLPTSVKKAAQPLAQEDGVSLNQWITSTVAQKVGVVETASDFLARRKAKAAGKRFGAFLKKAPRNAPVPHDQL